MERARKNGWLREEQLAPLSGVVVLVAATGLAALRCGALPRWLGWLSLALGLWLLIPPLGSAAGTPENPAVWTGLAAIVVVPVWTAITGVALMARGRP